MTTERTERLLELMADRVSGDLTRSDHTELAVLEAETPEIDFSDME